MKNYFYGPVPSRRLGFSLGVNLFSKKTCSFNCLYCQLGKSGKKITRRFSCIELSKLKDELKEIVSKKLKINYITISGSGEPTLHKSLDKIITAIKKVTQNKYPVAVITNSSLLYKGEVRNELKKADLIVPSLDAACEETFSKINCPHKGITFQKIISGLISLRKEFKGKIWLEIMLISGINDSKREIEKFKEIVDKINPDEIQLNLPVRPAGVKLSLPSQKRLGDIKKILGRNSKVVVKFSSKNRSGKICENLKRNILNFLKVRPASVKDLSHSLNLGSSQVNKQLSLLLVKKMIKICRIRRAKYFVIND